MPPEVGAAAYRIVQESLTNVLRHAGTNEASVRVRQDGGLLVEVADRGAGTPAEPARTGGAGGAGPASPASPAPATGGASGPGQPGGTGGTGIAGMRRRAESVGGRLSAGPRDGGGFLVRAELPA